MKWSLPIRKEIKAGTAVILLLTLIAFAERKQADQSCRDLVVELTNQHENHYLDEAEILKLVEKGNPGIRGTSFARLDFRAIEKKLEYDPHIKDAQVYADLKGNLVVYVELRRPVARIVLEGAPDAYIAEDGYVMSVSDKYTSRVILLSGARAAKMAQTKNIHTIDGGGQVLNLIETLREDDFWNAQIAQIDMPANGKLILFPQVTGQQIEFGEPDRHEEKLMKLKVFYKQILPQRGWTRYQRVNLEYDHQIIAE